MHFYFSTPVIPGPSKPAWACVLGESSNGRTPGSGPGNWGSNPYSPANNMRINLIEARDISIKVLQNLGFDLIQSKYVTQNLIDAELSNKKSHGLIRLLEFNQKKQNGNLNVSNFKLQILSESPTHLYIEGNNHLGYAPIYESLEYSFQKIKSSKILAVGIRNLDMTGYIGSYALSAVERDLIYLGFHNSKGLLVPFGSVNKMWGTNPLTVGIPTSATPVILDMSSSQITWGDLLVAKNECKDLEEGVAIDKFGNPTINPIEALEGGLLPFVGYKGSGLAFIVELLAGALTNSRIGDNFSGGWGSFYILIDPTLFRSLDEFKRDISSAVDQLKNSKKAKGFDEIYFAGERSFDIRKENLDKNSITITDSLYKGILNLVTS